MISDRLSGELEQVARRYERLWSRQAYAAALLVCSLIAILSTDFGFRTVLDSWGGLAVFSAVPVFAVYVLLRSRFLAANRTWVARQIEARYSDLNSCLLAAVEQSPSLLDGRYGFLQTSVITQALDHAASNDWSQVVSRRRMTLATLVSLATFALFMWAVGDASRLTSAKIAKSPLEKRPAAASGAFSVSIEPGNTEIERGSSLQVLARVQGPLPADATLVSQSAGSDATRLVMSPSLDDPIFGGRIPAVTQPFEYHVELGGHVTPTYHVTVFEYPRLERADARLTYPQYTGLETRLIQDVRTVSVVEGTEVTLICQLNKAVKSARFIENISLGSPLAPRGESRSTTDPATKTGPEQSDVVITELTPAHPSSPLAPRGDSRSTTDSNPRTGGNKSITDDTAPGLPLAELGGYIYQTTFIAEKTRRLKLELIDDDGRHNTDQVTIVVQVVPNQPPTLKLVAPGRDLEVSPLEELDLKATAWDDYGVKRMGVSFGLAGQPPTDVVLGENAAARQRHELANLIRFEDLKVHPDQLLAYHFWAEDFGPDGTLRRTSSDMYFAEVRHFDEIFREGQPPPGGQQPQQGGSPNAQAAQQLAQLQKDIINATWRLIRREIGSQTTAPFVEDVKQISESQSAALEQADALGEKVRDMESQAHLLAVLEAMQQAVKHLQAAQTQPAPAPLQPALAAEQAAYQGLLKLRAREHEVVRQQQQSSSSSSGQSGRSQQQRQQLQQLDIKDEENRYETQRLAQDQQEKPEDRETRQVLNRLKELARRQHDLNERLKDLQSALQEAQNEEKKEEIRQQLKRLQDEQRDVLRDTDELQSRMEMPDNQERMAEERQQLEQARDQVRRTSEALEKDQVTQAAASGTRAEKEFEELRNEFRRRASGRFNEELREMRDAARDLDQQEKKLSEQLAETAQPNPTKKSLRDDNRSEEIVQGLTEQKTKLSTLNERLKQTILDAEQTEPLLSEKLNDTARNLIDHKVERALEATELSVRRGFLEDARQVEQIAGRGIGQLREGIEKAAESVLGDETEALRRAREKLKDLAKELNQEIARNAPDEVAQMPGREQQAEEGQQGLQGKGQPGEQPGPREDGARQPGERPARSARNQESQPGQPQPGERRPGEQNSPDGQPGQQPAQGQQPGVRQPEQQGQRPQGQRPQGQRPQGQGQRGQGQPQPGERQPAQAQPNGQQPGEPQPGAPQPGESPMPQGQGQGQGQPQTGQQPQAGQPGQSGRPGESQRGGPQPAQPGAPRGARRLGSRTGGQEGGGIVDQTGEPVTAPISGGDFLDWSDRLRDVEEMVDDPELRAEAARIRDAARSIRVEMKRHSSAPNWKLVRITVAEPLVELSNRVADELLRRNSKQALVPLDRDPVPPKYSEKTRRYYERLGSGQ